MQNLYTFRQDAVSCFWECFGAWQEGVRENVRIELPADFASLEERKAWRFEERYIIKMARLKDAQGQVSGETFLNFLQRWRPAFERMEGELFYSVTLLDALCINLLIAFQAPQAQKNKAL